MSEDTRPTFIKVHRQHILPETLDAYGLPWEYSRDGDGDFIIIKQYLSHDFTRELFAHTERLREASRRNSADKTPFSRNIVSDEPYRAPVDTEGYDVSFEVNMARPDRPSTPPLVARRTTEMVAADKHLQSAFQLRHLLKASVVTSHLRSSGDDALGATLEYFDSPNRVPDTHFRWLHAQISQSSLDQYQLFLSQLTEIDNEEKALMLALLRSFKNDSKEDSNFDQPASFRLRRASAKRGQTQEKSTKWVLFLRTMHLAKASSRREDGLRTAFPKYRYPLRPHNMSYGQKRLHSIRQTFPTHELDVVRFSAFMTSSGFLVTFSSESLESLCQPSLSVKKLDSQMRSLIPRKIRLHTPDGTTFHMSPDLCDTYFDIDPTVSASLSAETTNISRHVVLTTMLQALKKAVVAVCSFDYSDDPDDYALFTGDDREIKGEDWQQYRSSQSSTYLEVYIRLLSVEPQIGSLKLEDRSAFHRKGSSMNFKNKSSGRSHGKIHKTPSEISSNELSDDFGTEHRSRRGSMDDTSDGSLTQLRRADTQFTGRSQNSKTLVGRPGKSVSFEQSLSKSRENRAADTDLPSNRTKRTLVDPPTEIIINSEALEFELEDLLFRTLSSQAVGTDAESVQTSKSKAQSVDDRPQESNATTETKIEQVTPFFLWPLEEPDDTQAKDSPTQSREQVSDILTDIDTSLSRGRLGHEEDRSAKEHLAKLYSALEPPENMIELNDIIKNGLSQYEPVKNEDILKGHPSWQRILFEVIRRWDSIVGSFYTGTLEHVVLQKYSYARASFYKHVSQICEQQFSHNLEVVNGESSDYAPDDSFFYVVDYAQIMDARLPVPILPDTPIEGCSSCQYFGRPQTRFTDRDGAIRHLRKHHLKSETVPTTQLDQYVVADDKVGGMVACTEARYLLVLILDHLKEIMHLIDDIQNGITTSAHSTATYRLPQSLVQAFTQFFGSIIRATAISLVGTTAAARSLNENLDWEKVQFASAHADIITGAGVVVEFTLNRTKNDLMLMSHVGDFSTTVSYAVVDSPYVLLNILGGLMTRNNSDDGLHLLDTYLDYANRLEAQIERRPGKRLQTDLIKLKNEIAAVRDFIGNQAALTQDLGSALNPKSFKVIDRRRKNQYRLEKVVLQNLIGRWRREDEMLDSLRNKLENLQGDNLLAVEILQDDQGKAILVLTTVTVIFLPLSFVASLLGMNTNDIRNLNSSQWLFWAIAVPLTTIVTVVVMMVSYLREEIREFVSDTIPSGLDLVRGRRWSGRARATSKTKMAPGGHEVGKYGYPARSLDGERLRDVVLMKRRRRVPTGGISVREIETLEKERKRAIEREVSGKERNM